MFCLDYTNELGHGENDTYQLVRLTRIGTLDCQSHGSELLIVLIVLHDHLNNIATLDQSVVIVADRELDITVLRVEKTRIHSLMGLSP